MPSRQSRAKAKRAPLTARTADPHDLYQRSVQCVEAEIDFVDRTFLSLTGRRAVSLREDFGGTANTACEWVRRRKSNIALAVDIDPEPIAWGHAHNVAALSEEQARRLTIRRADVLHLPAKGDAPQDAVLAMNFSYWCFKDRATLGAYFRHVHRSLAKDGIFFLDFYGGSDAHRELQERRRCGGFTYVWDQHRYNPVNGDLTCFIHFEFSKGAPMMRAFRYDWRLWSLPELSDLLKEAGFSEVLTYLEGEDGKGGGDGVFRRSTRADADRAFIAYIVARH